MKTRKKLICLGLVTAVGLVGFGKQAEAQGNNIQVPNSTLNLYLNDKLLETYVPEGDENPEEDRLFGGVPSYLFNQEFESFEPRVMIYDSSSLEGLQFVNTKKLTLYGQLLDLNPISEIHELEELDMTVVQGSGYGGYAKTGSSDLSFMRNKLTKLKKFTYKQDGFHNGLSTLMDISELSEHPLLEEATIQSSGGLQTISMRAGYRKYEVFNPVILSSQFDGAEISYSSPDANFTNTDGLLKWNAVPQDTEYLTLEWTVTQGKFHFEGNVQIPIDWK